ncbi:protein DpdJ [Leptolyngbya sp. GGD]|uniref:protein DpdJ n=1 Tax=Leptolyngbya sp. GGD TaxID=2997907 RepID=UPI00227A6BB3|nr:protein DpdJ [Leptolyngbya sp. GGD]MCY6493405.1 protein DpdJ [Leptolyngbya sp. GGD]
MDNSLHLLVREFLNRLESDEVKLLVWGVVDSGFSKTEIEELAEAVIQDQNSDVNASRLIAAMRAQNLLFDFNLKGRRVYRTRMAETVRLFARLRQLFPQCDWQTSPTLVADYRFSLRQRVYPARTTKPETVIQQLEADKLLTPIRRAALEVMLKSPDRTLDLSDFQHRATARMLRDLNSKKSRGMIVCAGTGTGKTLAFYLPALAHIAGLVKKTSFWTKALAIYPRNELLKDQFSETYIEARRLDAVLTEQGQRKLLIGAFFGATPRQANLDDYRLKNNWKSERQGFTCPYLRCPHCDGALSWRREDLAKRKEQLICLDDKCGAVIREDEIVLTRDRMVKTPPDLLFTTTEMLNRSMGDSQYGHIFGIGTAKPPQIVLLDEVHTYTGIHGAQVAYLLRRWQKMIGGRVQFTGLSATLRSAADFFTHLVGLEPGSVEEISPGDNVKPEGMEYLLALRGDPVSGTSLLSTSIQTAMLLRRVLDPSNNAISNGAYGSRVFAFTDDLDVTNRLFHNLLDAEGRNSLGRPKNGQQPLAAIRSHDKADSVQRLVAGQSWLLCEEIGHRLQNPLEIARTSSQDTGVDAAADVIVATAALEVGFNDPEVGAVIQHKAPRDMASFLQRKGRAGRSRAMRPWTVVVLSDYGRDRIAYQNYDLLFDPILEERLLPISNRYVIRIQAAFACMDWVAQQLQLTQLPKGSVWKDFTKPFFRFRKDESSSVQQRQEEEKRILQSVLEQQEQQQSLEAYLQAAMQLSPEETRAILWEPPRALMTAVLPTLLRRLESKWHRLQLPREPELDYYTSDPLPDFVPGSLFSDLLLPEVRIVTPPPNQQSPEGENFLPILQALKTFAPGRVSRRFGVQRSQISHWIAPPNLESGHQTLPVEQYCSEFEEAGTFQIWQNEAVADIRCIRPWTLRVAQIPPEVVDKSNAQLKWRTQIVPPSNGNRLDLPQESIWVNIVSDLFSFTHNQQNPLQVRRFALESEANLRISQNREVRELETTIQFVEQVSGNPAGVGFAQSVDGLVCCYQIPEDFTVSDYDANRNKVRSFRSSYFKHCILSDLRLDGIANIFQRDWLHQIYLSMLVARALEDQSNLLEAFEAIRKQGIGQAMAAALDEIFQTSDVEEVDEDSTNELADYRDQQTPNMPPGRQPTHAKLRELCNSPVVQEVLNDLAQILWGSPDAGWHEWAKQRFKATLGGALLEACRQLCPQFDSDDLLLDLDPGPRSPDSPAAPEGLEEIWLTEASPGGSGVIEEILQRYAADPLGFFRLVESALEPSDFEIVDSELTKLLELTATESSTNRALAQVRNAKSYQELLSANEQLRRVLTQQGILVTPAVMTAIHARVLAPGSTVETDRQLLELIRTWQTEETRLGVEIDARVFAYVASTQDRFTAALPLQTRRNGCCFQVLYGRLWLRGGLIRNRAISFYNPFAIVPEADREILLDVLQPAENVVKLEESNWREQVEQALRTKGAVSLTAQLTARQALKQAALQLMTEPISVGFLNVYPVVEGFRRTTQGYTIRLRIREAVQ